MGERKRVDKSFSFKIRYSVSSSYFKVNGTKVSVDCSAYIGDSSLYKFRDMIILNTQLDL